MDALRTEDQIQRAQQFRGLQGAAQATQANEMAKARLLAEADKYRTDVGLRGKQYEVDAGIYKAGVDADRAAAAAKLGRRETNMKDFDALIKDRFTAYLPPDPKKPGAPQQVDPVATQKNLDDVQLYFKNAMINNPAFAKNFPGITSIYDLPREQIEPLLQEFKTSRDVVGGAKVDPGDTPLGGMATDLNPRKMRIGDWVNMPWNTERNSIGLGQALWGASGRWNPFVMPDQQTVMQIGTQGNPTHNVGLRDAGYDTPEKKMSVLNQLESMGKKEQANELRAIWQMKQKP